MNEKVMTIEHVARIKGTQLIGKLEVDVKIGEYFTIKTSTHSTTAKLFIIETFGKLHESAPAGENIVLMFRNIADVEINPGDEVWR